MLRVREKAASRNSTLLRQMTAAAGKMASQLASSNPQLLTQPSRGLDAIAPLRENYEAEQLSEGGKHFLTIAVLPTFL